MHENDPTKHLTCYVSFDPAIDRDAMGADFALHFGRVAERPDLMDGRYGNRDGALVKTRPGKRPTTFELRPLRAFERAACDAAPSAESRWLHALQYALVRAELSQPLAAVNETVRPLPGQGSRLSMEALDDLGERVGIETLYEVGAVAYSRSKLSFFGEGFAPLPATSAHVLERSLFHAATLAAETSDTETTDAGSTSQQETPPGSGAPGSVTATGAAT